MLFRSVWQRRHTVQDYQIFIQTYCSRFSHWTLPWILIVWTHCYSWLLIINLSILIDSPVTHFRGESILNLIISIHRDRLLFLRSLLARRIGLAGIWRTSYTENWKCSWAGIFGRKTARRCAFSAFSLYGVFGRRWAFLAVFQTGIVLTFSSRFLTFLKRGQKFSLWIVQESMYVSCLFL